MRKARWIGWRIGLGQADLEKPTVGLPRRMVLNLKPSQNLHRTCFLVGRVLSTILPGKAGHYEAVKLAESRLNVAWPIAAPKTRTLPPNTKLRRG